MAGSAFQVDNELVDKFLEFVEVSACENGQEAAYRRCRSSSTCCYSLREVPTVVKRGVGPRIHGRAEPVHGAGLPGEQACRSRSPQRPIQVDTQPDQFARLVTTVLPSPDLGGHTERMNQLLSSPAYLATCDRIGQLVHEYGRDQNTCRTPAFMHVRPSSDLVGRMVASALKRFDFKPLLETSLLSALCQVTEGEAQLQGFRLVFLGLLGILEEAAPTES